MEHDARQPTHSTRGFLKKSDPRAPILQISFFCRFKRPPDRALQLLTASGNQVELMSVLDLLLGFGGSRGGGLFSGLDLYGTGMHRVVVWT